MRGSEEEVIFTNSPKTKQIPKKCKCQHLWIALITLFVPPLDLSSAVSCFTTHHSHHSLLILFIYEMSLCALSL